MKGRAPGPPARTETVEADRQRSGSCSQALSELGQGGGGGGQAPERAAVVRGLRTTPQGKRPEAKVPSWRGER